MINDFSFTQNVFESKQACVSYADLTEETFFNGTRTEWLELIDIVHSILPGDFSTFSPRRWASEGLIIAENQLFKVALYDRGTEACLGLIILNGSNFEELAKQRLEEFATTMFNALGRFYDLTIRVPGELNQLKAAA